jgi:hypothetical protein
VAVVEVLVDLMVTLVVVRGEEEVGVVQVVVMYQAELAVLET